MKNILISGANGFLGSHILRYVIENTEYNPFILIRKQSNLFRIKNNLNAATVFDTSEINTLFEQHKIDAIIHTATDYGRENNAIKVIEANVKFPTLMLQKAIENGTQKFINTDTFTSKIEGYPYLPFYHISKRNFKEWAIEITKDAPIQLITSYLGHLYGTFDSETKFLPFVINQLLNKVPEINLTAGEQKRDFVFAQDVAAFYMEILESTLKLEDIEVGTGLATSIKDVVLKCKKYTNNTNTQLNFGELPYRENEIMNAVSNTEHAKQLNFNFNFGIEKGLKETVAYFQQQMKINNKTLN